MIKVENLTKYYGELCAVDHVNFEIKKGEVLGMLGPNGAGKTTCMRILTCFLSPTDGNIHVGNLNVLENDLEIKKRLGYLPENAPLYPDMLVYDYLLYVANTRQLEGNKKMDRIRHLAGICGIKEVMHQPIGTLSKGYKQRVGLAQAMMGDPEILVLDEPTSGLDPNQIIEIRGIIKAIGKEKTVILCTHILSEAEATCDRVVIIHKGKIVADGDINSLKQSLGSGSNVHLTFKNAEFADIKEKLSGITGISNISQSGADNGIIHINLSLSTKDDIRETLYKTIKSQNWILLEFYQRTQSLENVFRELTKES